MDKWTRFANVFLFNFFFDALAGYYSRHFMIHTAVCPGMLGWALFSGIYFTIYYSYEPARSSCTHRCVVGLNPSQWNAVVSIMGGHVV